MLLLLIFPLEDMLYERSFKNGDTYILVFQRTCLLIALNQYFKRKEYYATLLTRPRFY
jgi:hypothetical protein